MRRMPGFRRHTSRQGRARIAVAIGAALVAGLFDIASSQAQLSAGAHKVDRNAPVLFQADEVQYDEQLGLTVAKGHVEISQGSDICLLYTSPSPRDS